MEEKKEFAAKVIADSIGPKGERITSFVVTFNRFVLAEFNTHRMFSRNSASSRAIPFKTMLKMVTEDPFIPMAFQKDHKGMQGNEYITGRALELRKEQWLLARDEAVIMAESLAKPLVTFGGDELDGGSTVTKQIVNRLLEPYMWHTVIVTATEFENFFALRCPEYQVQSSVDLAKEGHWRSRKDATKYHALITAKGEELKFLNPLPETEEDWLKINRSGAEIHASCLAERMWDAYNESTPVKLEAGEWHIPFGDKFDEDRIEVALGYDGENGYSKEEIEAAKIKIATARCARVSYNNFEGKDDYKADLKLYDILSNAGHWSPFEHVARAMSDLEYDGHVRAGMHNGTIGISYGWSGNFQGFLQLRKTFLNENKC
jgi:hypothetical protein